MNRGINIILLMLFVLTMSCAKEPVSHDDNKSGTNVELRFEAFNPRATTNLEEAVNRVRIIIFGSESSQDKGQLLCNKLAIPDNDGHIAPVIIPNGVRDIYLIVNEPLSKSGAALYAYTNIATVADIEALELAYVGTASTPPYIPSDIPMFVNHLNQNVYINSDNETNSNVERMMAKVTLNLNIKNGNFPTDKYPVIETITIKNLPIHSDYVTKPYTRALTTSELQKATAAATVETGFDHSYTNTFYVPEYILSAIDKNAYLEIKGYVNDDATKKETKWIVKVGDAMDGAKQHGNRYNITRNRHYTFTGDVKSYGEWDVKVTVLPWNSVSTDGDVGQDVLTINKTSVVLYDNIIDKSIFIGRETAGLVSTNVDIAKLFSDITYPDDMTTEQQGLELGIEPLDDNSITIKIKNGAKARYEGKKVATFDIQLGAYKHSISVTYGNNIIGYFGGNPIPALAGDGTMYPQRLEVALVDAPDVYQYKTVANANSTSIKNSIHYGRNMTISATTPANITNYPVFAYCASLNKDVNGNKVVDADEMVWYLPSQNQLMVMYIFNDGMDVPVKTSVYWSATEYVDTGASTAWFVDFSNGSTRDRLQDQSGDKANKRAQSVASGIYNTVVKSTI